MDGDPEENEEQNQGRRALWEAFEENAHQKVSGFQTGQITGLSDRRSHSGQRLIRILKAVLSVLRFDPLQCLFGLVFLLLWDGCVF
jgi:hypothetical protein